MPGSQVYGGEAEGSAESVEGMQWFVYRDGQKVSPVLESEDACSRWLMKHQPMSTDWATKHEGYSWMGEERVSLHLILQRGRLRLDCLTPDRKGPHTFYLYTERGGQWWSEVTKLDPVANEEEFRAKALAFLTTAVDAQR